MLLKRIKCFFKKIRSAKISTKLTVIYAIMFSLGLLILNASILFGLKYYLYSQANKQIEDIQTIMSNKVTSRSNSIALTDKRLFSDVPSKENIFLKITGQDGEVLNLSPGFDYKIKQAHNKGSGIEKHIEDKERHFIYKNVSFKSYKNGTVYVQIVKDMHSEYIFMKVLFVVMAAADFIGIIISIILGYMVSKRMLKPIDYITKTAQNISANNLKERIDVKGSDDELKRLANTFNNMIDRLQGAFNRQSQFVSDASHELRTPIAIIQGYANLLDRWGKNDEDALEKSIHGIKVEADNMASLIEKLLFLAKGDSGIQLVEKKKFLLNELIDEVVKESKLIEKNRKISCTQNAVVEIIADYKMIKQMLRIFIDNSIKFTPANGSIDISSEVSVNTVRITVSDTGIGIPKNELENIFNRFYVVDKSRAKEIGGSGLGLSIAKWIADIHKGTVDIKSEEGKWTKVIVTLKLR